MTTGASFSGSTADQIIQAAIELISEKGYKAATTKAIAELAGVNEVTLFRQFGNKRGIIKTIMEQFSYAPILKKTISSNVVWDLEEDLYRFSTEYQAYMWKIKDYVWIGFREAGVFPEIDKEMANIPLAIKQELIKYIEEMSNRGKIIDVDFEALAASIIHLNFGHFMARARLGSTWTDRSTEQIMLTAIKALCHGLDPVK